MSGKYFIGLVIVVALALWFLTRVVPTPPAIVVLLNVIAAGVVLIATLMLFGVDLGFKLPKL